MCLIWWEVSKDERKWAKSGFASHPSWCSYEREEGIVIKCDGASFFPWVVLNHVIIWAYITEILPSTFLSDWQQLSGREVCPSTLTGSTRDLNPEPPPCKTGASPPLSFSVCFALCSKEALSMNNLEVRALGRKGYIPIANNGLLAVVCMAPYMQLRAKL